MRKNDLVHFVLGAFTMLLFFGVSMVGTAVWTEETVDIFRGIRVYLDGVRMSDADGKSIDAFVHNGTTYVPIRAVGDSLGYEVRWDSATRDVYLDRPYALSGEKTVAAWGTYCTSWKFDTVEDATLRETVCLNASGNRVSVQLSNKWGREDIVVGGAAIARAAGEGSAEIDPATTVALTFGGERTVTIPGGMAVRSDAVPFEVQAGEVYAISLYFSGVAELSSGSMHGGSSLLSDKAGNFTEEASFSGRGIPVPGVRGEGMPLLETVNVMTEEESARTVVILGDSTSSNNWPALFQSRLRESGIEDVSVISRSCAGNRLMFDDGASGEGLVNRYRHDVLETYGVHAVIVKIGVNDLLFPVPGGTETAPLEEILQTEEELIRKLHEAGIKVYLCTITPFGGEGTAEENRLAWNEWIKTTPLADGYIDLCEGMEDPQNPAKLLDRYAIDELHPNDLGQKLIANSIPLEWAM